MSPKKPNSTTTPNKIPMKERYSNEESYSVSGPKFASITTRKGQFIIDHSKKDTDKKLIILQASPTGELEKIAETPVMTRLETIAVLDALTSYSLVKKRLDSIPGIKVLRPPSVDKIEAAVEAKKTKPKKKGHQIW